jgi:N-acetylmuramoyl-L-alanine amidase
MSHDGFGAALDAARGADAVLLFLGEEQILSGEAHSRAEKADRLEKCLIDRYHQVTGMPFHANTITPDMTDYHTFREIHSETTAAIIETGFLNRDREILTRQPDKVAEGITAGIICFIRNENLSPFISTNDGN